MPGLVICKGPGSIFDSMGNPFQLVLQNFISAFMAGSQAEITGPCRPRAGSSAPLPRSGPDPLNKIKMN